MIQSMEPVNLGRRKHLLIDFDLIERATNVSLRVQPPRESGTAIARDRAWEQHLRHQVTVIDDGGQARMWYTATRPHGGLNTARHGYAESDDGKTWRKPNLGLVELDGRADTNLVPDRPPMSTVFVDHGDLDP